MIHHAAKKLIGAAIVLAGAAYAATKWKHGKTAGGMVPVTPHGSTVTPSGGVVPPSSSSSSGGATGAVNVKQAQTWLNQLGYASPPLTVDGVAGPLTQAATRTAQRALGVTVDGIIGPQTYAALQSAAASSAGGDPNTDTSGTDGAAIAYDPGGLTDTDPGGSADGGTDPSDASAILSGATSGGAAAITDAALALLG